MSDATSGRNFLAGVEAETRGAGIDDAPDAIGAAVVQNRVTLARARPLPRTAPRHFFRDDSSAGHPTASSSPSARLCPLLSSTARIFASLRIYRGSFIGVLIQTSTTSSASFGDDKRGAEAQHVRTVMLPRVTRHRRIVTHRCANTFDFVGRNRRSDAGAVDDNTRVRLAAGDRLATRAAVSG